MIHRPFNSPLVRLAGISAALGTALTVAHAQTTGPLKVFIMSGQSNMQGHGLIAEVDTATNLEKQGTLKYFADNNPAYNFLRPGGTWVTRTDTWVWQRHGDVGDLPNNSYNSGNLTPGFGAWSTNGPNSWLFGPEYGFGMKLGNHLTEQVVLVKIAWGGSSLAGSWRPPSAVAKRGGILGDHYTAFLEGWQQAQTAIATQFPSRAIQLSGFVWHQGENDAFDTAATAEYAANLGDLIVDIRSALNSPALPVVIATTSNGPIPAPPNLWYDIESAQLAMTNRENVTTVNTMPNYLPAEVSARNEPIHWNKNGESIYKNAELMGDAMIALLTTPDAPDTTPPSPNPLGFSTPPTVTNNIIITMTANAATDINGVQYRFVETSGNPGGTSSDWQYSRTYTDTGLANNTTYSYRVEARDQSAAGNVTTTQAALSATTTAPDITAPTPNPMTWTTPPAAISSTKITMTASTASDVSGVEYFFDETSGNPGGTDSGWQSSPSYTDTGLTPSTQYTYRVRARDIAFVPNETTPSAAAQAATQAPPPISTLYWDGTDTTANANGGAGTWMDGSNNWDSAATAGVNTAWNNDNKDIAVFGGSADIVTIGGGGVTVSDLVFNTTGYTITGDPLTVSGASNVTINTGATIHSSLVGNFALTKSGTGTLRISSTANTFTGGTTITGGTLFMDINSTLGTGPVTLNGGILYLWRFYPANPLIVNGGTLLSENGFGNVWSGPITLNATFDCDVYYQIICNNTISGSGGITKRNGGPMILSGNNTYTGPTNITGGTLRFDTPASLGSGALSISAGGAKANLNYTGTRTIASLSLGGVAQAAGTYGSTASSATNKNDSYFSGAGILSVGVAPNTAPVATAQNLSGTINTPLPITLAAADAEGNPLTYAIVSGPSVGSLSGTAPNVTYSPPLNFTGVANFTFRANDGNLNSEPATVLITVSAAATSSITGNGNNPLQVWGNETDGYEFTTSAGPHLIVSSLGFYDAPNNVAGGAVGDGILDSHRVRLWKKSTSTLIVTTTVTPADSLVGNFRTKAITPVILAPNTTYIIAADYTGGRDRLQDGSNLTGWTISGMTIVTGRYNNTNESMPLSNYSILIGPNFQYTPITVDADSDGDGVSNGLEYILGGNALTNDLSKLPALTTTGGDMSFVFYRAQGSIGPNTNLRVEVSTDLLNFATMYDVPDGAVANNQGITVEKNTPALGMDKVTLRIPQGTDTKKFARLKVIFAPY